MAAGRAMARPRQYQPVFPTFGRPGQGQGPRARKRFRPWLGIMVGRLLACLGMDRSCDARIKLVALSGRNCRGQHRTSCWRAASGFL